MAVTGRRPSPDAHAGEGLFFSPDPLTGCWEWLGNVQPVPYGTGYGRFTHRGVNYRAHRVVYEAHRGRVPEGLTLDHLCGNTRCVNPDHLEPVSAGENVRRGRRAKLTWMQVNEIRRLLAEGGLTQDEIGARFGVSRGPVSNIACGRAWYPDARGESAQSREIPAEVLALFRAGGAA